MNVLVHEYPWREGYGPKPPKQPLVPQEEKDSEVMKVKDPTIQVYTACFIHNDVLYTLYLSSYRKRLQR